VLDGRLRTWSHLDGSSRVQDSAACADGPCPVLEAGIRSEVLVGTPILPRDDAGFFLCGVVGRAYAGGGGGPVADRWRFDRKVVWSPTCLWWVGAIGDDGYGRFASGTGRVMSAHRWLWEHDVGPLPAGVRLRHCCDETGCVRLAHLIPGSHRLNMGDMTRRGRAGGPHHHGRADIRGPAGRARAIRAALTGGYHPDRLTAAMIAGEPWRQQLALFPTPTPAEPPRQRAAPGRGSCPSPTRDQPGGGRLQPGRRAGGGASGRAVGLCRPTVARRLP